MVAEKEGFEPSRRFPDLHPQQGRLFGLLSTSPQIKIAYTAKLLPTQFICMPTHILKKVEERVGFEPTDARTSPVFKTGSFNRSDISPQIISTTDRIISKNLSFVNTFFKFFYYFFIWTYSSHSDCQSLSFSFLPSKYFVALTK